MIKAYDEWTKLLPKGELDHPARVYLIDQSGNIREVYSLAFFNEEQAKLDTLALLREGPPVRPGGASLPKLRLIAKKFAERVPRVETEIVPDALHVVHFVSREKFNALVSV